MIDDIPTNVYRINPCLQRDIVIQVLGLEVTFIFEREKTNAQN
jgi:hypothetical protein